MATKLLDNGFVALFILVDIRWFVALLLLYLELFSIELHHGGEISCDLYAKGKVTYIDNYDKDLMSLQMIDDMVKAVGHSERFMNYYYKIPNMDLCNGLKLIQSDSDVQQCAILFQKKE
ncbi:hypothetical protein D8674_021785 [Pyrus ussuriensis x Pyrus communis]|uniref:PB1-like domain-containing protein n=1 Tax=Pyrus ussuriensis x Pyrus communis TaxID=2448454 RepID=A0A5N5GJ82_9ROSA|nr:hypothetical protein D8674_021785 [Pyrus ussuriensis x Pyrus communis]